MTNTRLLWPGLLFLKFPYHYFRSIFFDTASSVTPKVRPRLPQSKLETHRLWHEDGLSVDAVAEVRCNKASTIRGYLSGEWSVERAQQQRRLSGDVPILLGSLGRRVFGGRC